MSKPTAVANADAPQVVTPQVVSIGGWNHVMIDEAELQTSYVLQFSDDYGLTWNFVLKYVDATRKLPVVRSANPDGGEAYSEKAPSTRDYRYLRIDNQQ